MQRRRFSAKEKLRILEEADAYTERGEIDSGTTRMDILIVPESMASGTRSAAQDAADAQSLSRLLEDEVATLFYKRDADDVPRGWVRVMKEAIRTSAPVFCTRRMVKEYTERFYIPATERVAR